MVNIRKRKEALTGYVMVAPALIIICVIALFPLLQTIYYSFFDYQLNNPAKNEIILRAKLDLEKYADAQFYLADCKIALADITENKLPIADVLAGIAEIDDSIAGIGGVSEKYPGVKQKVDAMEAVADEDIKYVDISRQQASELKAKLDDVIGKLQNLRQSEGDIYIQTADILRQIKSGVLSSNFIGFDNYKFFGKQMGMENGMPGRMGQSILNTALFTIVSVAVELVLGLAIAMLANKAIRGKGLIRTCMLIPWAIPTVVSAMMWKFMYDGQSGVISHLLSAVGLIADPGLIMGTSVGSILGIIAADIWKTTPYMALLLLAGLQLIPEQLYESSEMDGATRCQQFFKITLPMLKSTLVISLLFRSLDAFRIFDLIYVMTGGGPGYSTESISIYAYKTMFSQMDFGKGSTIAVILFICVFIMSCFYIKLMSPNFSEKEE